MTEIEATTSAHVIAIAGDIAMLVGLKHKKHVFRLEPGRTLHTHRGELKHDQLIGTPWGTIVRSHLGRTFHLLEPSLADLINELPRRTQILYPKDIGFILLNLGVGPGKWVGEAGSGSGAMTLALSHFVGDNGHVLSYDLHQDSLELARKNLNRFGHPKRVSFTLRDISEGIDAGQPLDAFFLDVPNPEAVLAQVRACLKPGGGFACIVPTTNQLSVLLETLENNLFAFIEICEIMLRYYRPNPQRLRPTDRMIAHTGFLVFARPVMEREVPTENSHRVSGPDEDADDADGS